MAEVPAGLTLIEDKTPPLPVGLTLIPESAPVEEDTASKIGTDLANRLKEDVASRRQEQIKTLASFVTSPSLFQGGLAPGEALVQLVGQEAGSFFDALGSGINAAARGASLLLPDSVEKPVADAIKRGYDYLSETSAGQFIADELSKGVEGWAKFKETNPRIAKDVESAVNIGLLVAPVKTKIRSEPIKPMDGVAKYLEKAAIAQETGRKREFIKELVSPKQTAKVKLEQVGRTQEKGLLARKEVVPTPREAEMMEELMRVRISPKESLQGNYNIISKANESLAKQLAADVAKSNKIVPKKQSSALIDDAVNNLIKSNPVIVGNAETTAKRVATKAKEIIDSKPATASGVLEARKELDYWIRSQKGDAVFDPASENALSIAVREVRKTMNDIVDANVASTKVKNELRRQSLLFEAMDNIAPKAADEASTAIGRLWQNAARVVPFKAQLNKELAVLLGMSTFGAAAYLAPYLVGGLVITGAGIATAKGLASPQMKRGVANVVRLSDRAIRLTKNPEMLRQLRADRAAAIEFLKNVKTQEGEENSTEEP